MVSDWDILGGFFTWFKHQTTSFDGRFFVVLDFWTPEITSEIKGVSSTTWLCLKISLPWSILDQIFLGVHERNMSFTACCWKSWRKNKKNMSSFLGGIYIFKVSWVPPLHLQANIIAFTHAYWWQSHMACVWIFRLLVSPSSRKAGKKHFLWLEDNKNYHFSGFAGVCEVFAGVLRGVLVAKNIFQWFLWYVRIIWDATKLLLCGANLDFPSTNGSNW